MHVYLEYWNTLRMVCFCLMFVSVFSNIDYILRSRHTFAYTCTYTFFFKRVHLLITRSTLRFIRSKVSSPVKNDSCFILLWLINGIMWAQHEFSMRLAWAQHEFLTYDIILGRHDVSMMLVWGHIEVSMGYLWDQYNISIRSFLVTWDYEY